MDHVPLSARPPRRYRPPHPRGALAVLAVVASASAMAAMVAWPLSIDVDSGCAAPYQSAASQDAAGLRRDSLLAAACWPYNCVPGDKLHAN